MAKIKVACFFWDTVYVCICVCRSNIRKAHVSAIVFALSQSFLFFSYAAIFTFATWLIINRGLHFEDMFK